MRSSSLFVASLFVPGLAVLVPLLLATAAAAQPAQPAPATCPTVTPAPAALAGWNSRIGVRAATHLADVRPATLTIGRGVDAMLTDAKAVAFVSTAHAAADQGGLFAFSVQEQGRYRVALGGAAWVDVLRGDTALGSAAHAHGPDCTGIRKIVDFNLVPGRYVLQIDDAADPRIAILIARAG